MTVEEQQIAEAAAQFIPTPRLKAAAQFIPTPRLNTISGTALGESLIDAYGKSLRAVPLNNRITEGVSARILHAVDELVQYAQGDGKLEAKCDVDDQVLKLMPLLEHPLGRSLPLIIRSVIYDTIDPDALNEGDVLDELALVIAAALGRQALNGERDIRTSWLAAVASVSLKTVERAKLKPVRVGLKGWVTTKAARAWLKTRNDEGGQRP